MTKNECAEIIRRVAERIDTLPRDETTRGLAIQICVEEMWDLGVDYYVKEEA